MSDPAKEAAKRVGAQPNGVAAAAARRALEPIRELHQSFEIGDSTGLFSTWCAHCNDSTGHPSAWPCATARLVYSSEELL